MGDGENWLLKTRLREARARIAAAAEAGAAETGAAQAAWRDAQAAVSAAGADEEAEVALPVLERDLGALDALLAAWDARTLPLAAWDQAVLKRALNAYKRRLKLTRAEDEFSSSRNPMSRGVTSGILGTRPPEQYPQDVWDLLVAQGRLRDGGNGLLEPGGGPV